MSTRFIAAVAITLNATIAVAQVPGVIAQPPTIIAGPIVPSVPYYQLTDLGVLEGQSSSFAWDINNSNAVIGTSGRRSFVYRSCRMNDLGTLGGDETRAMDIHDTGTIVGWSRNSAGTKRPFIHSGGLMSDIGNALVGDAVRVGSWNIPVGHVAASEAVSGDAAYFINNEAFLLPRVRVSRVATKSVQVTDMTDTHRVLGSVGVTVKGTVTTSETWGMVSANGFGAWTRIAGVPGFETSVRPRAINTSGAIVGSFDAGQGYARPFLSTNPSAPAQDLGVVPGYNGAFAYDINNGHWIVGTTIPTYFSGQLSHGFVRAPGGGLVDLNTRLVNSDGWIVHEALALNDTGHIVGRGIKTDASGTYHRAIMLTPTALLPKLPCIAPPIVARRF
jgi:probable HAF family extracellular repeat protein